MPGGEPTLDAALKMFASPPPERAGVYVVRSSEAAPAVLVDVDVDGVPLGRLGPRSYLYREVTPGRHTVTAHAGSSATSAFDVDTGALVFVRQEMTWGFWQAGVRLRLVGEEEGRRCSTAGSPRSWCCGRRST